MIYELTYLITPEMTDEEAEKFHNQILEKVKELEGTVKKISSPQRRELSYPIEKQNAAYLSSLDFKEGKIREIEKELEKEEKIIRYLLLKKKEVVEEEKPEKEEKPKREIKKSKKVKLKEIDDKIEEIL